MSDDLDRERFDYDDRDTSPGAFHERILCEGCGREYEALVTFHDRSHDSPAWYEPEPGEDRCPACRDGGLGYMQGRGAS